MTSAMTKTTTSVLSLVLLLQLCHVAQAQQTSRDTAFVEASVAFARTAHEEKTKKQSRLYNGSQYGDYNSQNEEHPYYLSSDWMKGTVTYADELFNAYLLYDIHHDKLIAEHFAGAFVELIKAKVSAFTIEGHVFRQFTDADDARHSIQEGFYEVLHDGKTKILARYSKTFMELVKPGEITRLFDEKTRYFVVKNNTFYAISSKAGLLRILSDKKKELKRMSRENKVVNSGKGATFTRLAGFYDSLTQ
jgi:hypothetical protein